jgi:putative transposase
VKANRAQHHVSTMCEVFDVSESGYHAWCKRPPSKRVTKDAELTTKIKAAHAASYGNYGAPMILRDLRDDGIRIGQKRVARLMRAEGIAGTTLRRFCMTTQRDGTGRQAPDLVDRNFKVDGPNKLWVADITYVPTWTGFLFLAVVLDAWSRKIVGWSMAVKQRRPSNVIHHSDQGCQYTSIAFGKRCRELDVRPSMGSVGDAYDNAMCESFFATLERELLQRRKFASQREARTVIFQYIEGWYNRRRRHSSLDYMSPLSYEEKNQAAA